MIPLTENAPIRACHHCHFAVIITTPHTPAPVEHAACWHPSVMLRQGPQPCADTREPGALCGPEAHLMRGMAS